MVCFIHTDVLQRISGQHSVYAFHSKLLLGVFLQKYDLAIFLHERDTMKSMK